MQKSVLFLLVTFIVFSFTAAVIAQDTEDTSTPSVSDERLSLEAKEKENPASKDLKLEKEIKPRLPNGFAPVVDAAQREKIYTIQKEYNELIALLELRIKLLKQERDTKIDAVLTPSQLERVKRPAKRIVQRSM